MSIEVKNLSKKYGEQFAVNKLNFKIKKGEIVGLLGPNGAGKSTTMKILTGYISASSGTALVCGKNVDEESLEVRSRVGYLPEQNPLYFDMYVKEYLNYVARVHKVKSFKYRVEETIKLTGLGPEQHKKIGQLSKGYKQRVGIAQALLHDPEVLILDEPTSGLDPNQLVEIRELIKQIGKKKTVILSTHIMQEVELLCDRVIIINKGKLVANNSVQELQEKVGKSKFLLVEFAKPPEEERLLSQAEIKSVKSFGNLRYKIEASDDRIDLRKVIFEFAVKSGNQALSMNKEEMNLEQIFRVLTSKTA